MAKPIDRNYLKASLESFDKDYLSKKYGQGGNSSTGDENKIESISVNGEELTPDQNKNVDIIMPDISELENNSHPHENKETLDKFGESEDGKLLFNGEKIEGGSGVQGEDGITPHIGDNDNWYIGDEDTGVSAKGKDGKDGKSIVSIEKDTDNNIIVTFTDGETQNIGQLDVDIQGSFLTEEGFGNLRYYNGHFQYYNTDSSTWLDTSITPENVYIINMIPQDMKSIKGIYDIDLGYNKLKWEEPNDTIIDGQTACVVEKVVFRRKLDSVPIDEKDGELVFEVNRRDFGLGKTWYVDKSFKPTLGETWYYRAFPVSTNGFINTSTKNQISVLCKDYYLYGFKLDQNESDPSSMITYIEDNVDFSSAYMDYTSDTFNYGDWEDFWFIRDLKPCMLNYDGTVAYDLDKNDYSKKVDGTDSNIADDTFSGNAMIGFPKVYWKIVDNGDNAANIYFSDKKVDEDFACWSHIDNNGNEIDYCYMPIYNGSNVSSRLRSLSGKTPMNTQSGTTEITYAKANNQTSDIIWYTEVFSDRQLVNLLLLLIGKSTDTQTVFGNGHYTGGTSASSLLTTGTLNDKGLFYGTNGTGKGVKVFGMEHWWGNQWRRIAGWINNKGTQMIKLTYGQSDGSTIDGYNTDGTGYISIGYTPSGTTGGYISKIAFNENGLIPITASGSATTYYTDGLWFNNSQVDYAVVGGSSSNGLLVGALCSNLNTAVSDARWSVGAAVSCKPLA